jgi:hypothetical protein
MPGRILSDLTLAAIQAEATRAHLRHGEISMLGAKHTDCDRLAILVEEVGEVARELCEHKLGNSGPDHKAKLAGELIQVAAMACSWVEQLEGAPLADEDTEPHRCMFPVQPPRGSLFDPGPCECGKTWARSQAETQLAAGHAAMAALDDGQETAS